MVLKNANVFVSGQFQSLDIRVENGKFTEIAASITDKDAVDCSGKRILPGIIDMHSHGCVGHDFAVSDAEGINRMTNFYASKGVTSVLATTITAPKEETGRFMKKLNQVIAEGTQGSKILGINMEGPFLATNKKGAHDERFLIAPEKALFEEWDKESGNRIKLIDLDPDYAGALSFIAAYSGDKVISIAHTSCTYDTAMKAFAAGAANVTHIFNAMNPIHHREPGLIPAFVDSVYTQDRYISAELICDGFHVHPAVVRLLYHTCGANIVLISDSMSACGLSDGEYELGGLPVFVKDGKAMQKDGTIAGSTANVYDCMVNAIRFGVPCEQAICSATSNPAKVIGVDDRLGCIRENYEADFIIADEQYQIEQVYINGKRVSSTL